MQAVWYAIYVWDTRQVIESGNLSIRPDTMQKVFDDIRSKYSASDNHDTLVGGNDKEALTKINSHVMTKLHEGDIIDWDRLDAYWNSLSSAARRDILSKDDFADPDDYKGHTLKTMPSAVANNLLKFLPKMTK
jgi:hypothetical protein